MLFVLIILILNFLNFFFQDCNQSDKNFGSITDLIFCHVPSHSIGDKNRTVQSINKIPHYNTDLYITWSCCGSHFFTM